MNDEDYAEDSMEDRKRRLERNEPMGLTEQREMLRYIIRLRDKIGELQSTNEALRQHQKHHAAIVKAASDDARAAIEFRKAVFNLCGVDDE